MTAANWKRWRQSKKTAAPDQANIATDPAHCIWSIVNEHLGPANAPGKDE
jgi:hypothetical protein